MGDLVSNESIFRYESIFISETNACAHTVCCFSLSGGGMGGYGGGGGMGNSSMGPIGTGLGTHTHACTLAIRAQLSPYWI